MDNAKEGLHSLQEQAQRILIRLLKEHFGKEIEQLSDYLPDLFEQLWKVRLVEDKELRKLGLNFLCEAKRDLKTCNVLYSKKFYPHATYHFQQAVEKASKGYMLGFGLLTKEELFTHDTPELFLKALLEKTGVESWANRLADENLKELIDKAKLVIGKSEKRQEVAQASYEEINKHICSIDVYKDTAKRMCQSVISEISRIIEAMPPPPPIFQALSALAVLFILAAISFPHEAYTRYPDKEITPSNYTATLGVVRAIPKMMKYLQPEINNLKTVISG